MLNLNSNKIAFFNALTAPIFYVLLLTFWSGFFFSFSFSSSSLYSDEVFLVFRSGVHLFDHWVDVFVGPVGASFKGWENGRFITPVLHLFGTVGLWLTFWFSEFFGVDLLTAYGFGRSLAFALSTTSIVYFVWTFLPGFLSSRLRILLTSLSGPLILSTMVTNSLYSSMRANPWTYTIVLAIIFVLFSIVASSARSIALGNSRPFTYLKLGLCGFLFGTTYEFTQVMGPIAVLVFVLVFATERRPLFGFKKSLKSAVLNWGVVTLFLSFVVPFALVRVRNFLVCAETVCYAPANVDVAGIAPGTVAGRILSSFPPFSISFGLEQQPDFWRQPQNYFEILGLVILFSLPTLALVFYLLPKVRLEIVEKRRFVLQSGFYLGLLGMSMSLILALGISSSQHFQEQGALGLGESHVDTFGQNVAHSVFYLGLAIIILAWLSRFLVPYRSFGLLVIFVAGLFSSAAFLSNLVTTQTSQAAPGVFLQQRFASELLKPDLSAEGAEYRCALVERKLRDFAEWEGHDRFLVAGLEGVMLHKYDIPFCNLEVEFLFQNYRGS